MKRHFILRFSLVLLVFWGFYSCNNELIDAENDAALNQQAVSLVNKKTALKTTAANGFMEDVRLDPALEWWQNEQGTLAAPYLYDVYFGTTPYAMGSPNYAHYLSIIWNSYSPYDGSGAPNYKRVQIQYKVGRGSTATWYYPKTEVPTNNNPFAIIYKQYGLFQRIPPGGDPYKDYPIDLNSVFFPNNQEINIRFRVVSNNFPGPNIGTASNPKYDKSLASQWSYNERLRYNYYGFNLPQPIPDTAKKTWNNESNDDGILNVKVFIPIDTNSFTYSYYISAGSQYINGEKAPWGGEGSYNISKELKSGIVRVVVTEENKSTQEKRTVTKTYLYLNYDTKATFAFQKTDF
jgi:hypothetical protein